MSKPVAWVVAWPRPAPTWFLQLFASKDDAPSLSGDRTDTVKMQGAKGAAASLSGDRVASVKMQGSSTDEADLKGSVGEQ